MSDAILHLTLKLEGDNTMPAKTADVFAALKERLEGETILWDPDRPYFGGGAVVDEITLVSGSVKSEPIET